MKIGIDLGGTKIEAVAIHGNGVEIIRKRVPTPRGSYRYILDCIVQLVKDVENQLGQSGTVGVGIPGAISQQTGLVKNANTTELIGHPFDRDLARFLDRPVKIANDANCFTLSEATDGAAQGHRSVFGVILGTGCGGGVVVHGRLWEGKNAIAGEWGHNPLPYLTETEAPGPHCYCGRYGCIETFVSGTGLEMDYHRQTGESLKSYEIAKRSEEGSQPAIEALERLEDRLARSLALVINIIDPDCIVIGGGLSNLDRLYENIPQIWHRYIFSDHVATKLVKARHGDSSGVRGAAHLWNERS